MYKRGNIVLLSLLIYSVLFPSCATILTGSNQLIKVNPEIDVVYVNGIAQESTDSLVKVKRKLLNENKVLVTGKSGKTTAYKRKFNEVSLLNFIILPFWAIDLITGSVVKYNNQNK